MSEETRAPGPGGRPMGRGPMGGPMGGMGAGEKAKNFKVTMGKLLRYLAKYKLSLILVVLFAIGSAAFFVIGPKILGNVTTEIYNGLVNKIQGTGTGIDFTLIGRIMINLLCLYVVSACFSFAQGFIISGVAQKVSYRMRDEISKKINRLPMKFFDRVTHGEVLSRVTNDVDTLSQSLNQSLPQLVSSVTMLVGTIIMMFSISWLMTVVTLLILPLSMLAVSSVVKRSQKYFKQQQKFLGQINGQVEEVYGGHNVVKAFNGEAGVVEEFDKTNETLYGSAWKSQFLSGMMMPMMTFIGNISYVMVSILGGYLAIKKTITVGDIQSFIQYVRSFNQPIAQAAQVANFLQSTAAAAERVFEFLEEEEEVPEADEPVSPEGIRGQVEFRHVKFGYNSDKLIIRDFNAIISPGQKIAIVGPTGAGKTTIIKLLMRFYDVSGGAILIDGHDIRDFRRNDLRGLFGMVLQDTWLFSGTLRENIRYGKLDATDAEVEAAARAAHIHHFIRTQPGGYDMELNEEASNISQGQKQLLTIARAILADPRILILDEATSSVDTRTEIRIQKAMDNLMQGRTSFIIAHRLSTIRDADLILVMRDGDIVEQGSHEELLEAGGYYSELYNAQFESSEAV
ncbi:ABC transporter ATP-binding protein [Papillibacter cinnamivorans]|uniref:ATP-binding cassette, subfamily B n=1 Tax=Papillibacter cinnamivorans DSM 12816 TaxID=1122930 RepID=A0A1W2BTC6_9FIRM|nr:ATP-binding cassette, subfamily B [Papillibacter cinnamivorans DSM 12816]